MIKSVWQEKPSSGHRRDNDFLKDTNIKSVDKTPSTIHNSEKPKWKNYTNFKKGIKNLKKSKNKNDHILSDTKQVISEEIDNSFVISKSDENWIRIQVTSDESILSNSTNSENSISEVIVNYIPENLNYNEKAIDVPEDFIRNQCNCRNAIRRNKDTLRQSIQDFLREDWIQSEIDERQKRKKNSPKIIVSSNKNDLLRNSYPNFPSQKPDNWKMGSICSTRIGKHSVVPIDSDVVYINEEKQTTVSKTHNKITVNEKIIDKTSVSKSNNLKGINDFSTNPFLPDATPSTSSSIEWDNILHRRNTATTSKPQINTQTDLIIKTSPLPETTTNSSNNSSSNNWTMKYGGNFFKNFSGSVQNLVHFTKHDRVKSASENNLAKLNDSKLNKYKSNRFSSNLEIDYCPSVLYSRKQIADTKASAIKEKSGFGNLKNFKRIFAINLPKMKKSKNETIQEIDGGFFEKFGSLLRQKSQLEETNLSTPLAPLPEEEDAIESRMAHTMEAIQEIENDSGTETLHETDSEPEDTRAKHESFIEGAVGMNIDELYEEILHEILHNLGCEATPEVCQTALFEYVQEAFKIPNDKHDEIFKSAEMKEPPEIRLNVEIIKAENLVPKDSNGFSDPFVTLFLESNTTHRYNTSVKSATLDPLWEEHFSLPISENANSEILVIEVWDFDPAETVGEKMNKFFEVKGIRGLRKLMKEIAVTASTGKHDNELIGRTAIPLKTIPASGIQVWYNLEKGNKTKSRGSVLIRMSFSAEKNNRVAAQEHRNLLRILLMHELETSKVAPYWWHGKFSAQGDAVLTQHSAQSGLTPIDCALAQWSVFASIHQDHSLAFGLFIQLLDKIIPSLQTAPPNDEEVKLFWEGAKRLLPSCFSIIRKLRKRTVGDKNNVKMLSEVLEIMSKISMLEPPEGTDLLPKKVYGWLTYEGDEPNWDIRSALKDAVNSGALDWYEHINEGSECPNSSEEDRLQHLIKLIQLIRSDLQRSIEYYDKHFQQKMHFHYAQTLYSFYEQKLAENIQPVVEDVCRNLKRLSVYEDKFDSLPEIDEMNMGTTLFELYLVLKRFTVLGSALCPGQEDLCINQYHIWFTPGVTHWLDISVYKALTRIDKAIELDKLIAVDETVKYSSSAVDTLAIFYQIKIFWQQLGWPDIEGAYMFVGKIVDDICRCCVFYADRMSKRITERYMNQNQQRFEVTSEWCLAINNIDYIRQSLSPFIKELGADDIIARLGEYRSSLEADRCAQTLKNVIENAIDTERNKILELIEVVARKMAPAMRRFLTEGAEILHEDSNSMERLMVYLEESLKTLHTELNEVNFERILDAIWTELSAILYELVQSNLDKRRPPAFFANLRDTLHIMITSFKLRQSTERTSSDKETLEHIQRLLDLHAFETADLIHQYYLERRKDQEKLTENPYGQLTVRCSFKDTSLEIEILNAKNLIPMDSNGTCDSFVKVHFMPSDKFLGVSNPKTSSQSKTLFPLYDEKFTIHLTPEQRKLSNAVLIFSVKDKDLFGMSNQYIAECYLCFYEFENSDNEQIHLTLSRPEYKDTDCLRALEYRQGDKQARDFIKKLKQKAY